MTNQKAFMQLVQNMRKAQKHYFESRIPSDLERAKKLEKQVDAVLQGTFQQKQARLL